MKHYESLGTLLKEETLLTVDQFALQNTLVLESLEPFPGYHGENVPFSAKPESIYLATNKLCSAEEVFRISENLCRYHEVEFDACPGEIFVYNTHIPCIRIRGLNDYSKIADLLGGYLDNGITFLKKRNINAPALIKIEKVFSVEKMENFYYKDLVDELTFYVRIPYHFNWNLFRKATFNVKNNLENRNFDAALGFMYLKHIMDFIRIYTKNPDIKRLQGIRDKYLDEIKRIQEDQ
jgi:hypothetical protein